MTGVAPSAELHALVAALGRYRVHGLLGQGGMSEVLLVEHVALGRIEALKALRPHRAATPELVSRFRREARAAGRLHHPNIVAIHDVDELADGRTYITMEYVKGQNLDHVLEREGRVAPPRAVRLVRQLVGALEHAHGHGVIHRDLKPANLVLGHDEHGQEILKVLDFGLAKIITPTYADSVTPTGRGKQYGTPAYMAPEQFRGASAGASVDLYGLGCLLFDLCTGRPPFVGRSADIMHSHVFAEPLIPSRTASDAGISPALDALILALLVKDADARPGLAQVASTLSQIQGEPWPPPTGT